MRMTLGGGADQEEALYRIFKEFLEVAIVPNNISLKASKTRIGYSSIVYGGYKLGQGQRSLAEKHLAPILDMTIPEDVSALRRVLGLFVQSKSLIKNYALIVAPLTRLTGKVPWQWGEKQQEAFIKLKEAILEGPALANPDYTRPFYIDVDSSERGCGGALYQVRMVRTRWFRRTKR